MRTKHYHKESKRELERNIEESDQWFEGKQETTTAITEEVAEDHADETESDPLPDTDQADSALVEEEV